MTMQLLIRCAACDKAGPSDGKIRPDVQRETGLLVLSPPQGWLVVVDTTPTMPMKPKNPPPVTKEAMAGVRGGALGAPRPKTNVRLVCSVQCAGTLLAGLGDGLAKAFADVQSPPGVRGSVAYRAPMLTLRVLGPFPGDEPARLDRNLLHETEGLDRE
jgi:hypothetical protein